MPKLIGYIAAVILAVGIFQLPYGYYTLLRIVGTVSFGWLVYETYQQDHKILPWCYGFFAILFNPIAPVYLSRSTWFFIDLIAAGVLAVSAWKFCK